MYDHKISRQIYLLLIIILLGSACSERTAGPDIDSTPDPLPNGDIEWISFGAPAVSSVSAMALKADGGLLAGTANHGIFLLADGDSVWQDFSDGLVDFSITVLAVDVAGNMFAGTATEGMYRRTPADTSWSKLSLPGLPIWSIAFAANNSILAGTISGTYRSGDNGANWATINQGIGDTILVSITVDKDGQIYGGAVPGGVFTSTNNGDSWRPTGLPLISILSLATNAAKTVFAGTLTNGLLYSDDQGQNWQTAGSTFPVNASINVIRINLSQHVFAGGQGDGVYRSKDDGSTWEHVNEGLPAADRQILAMAFNNTHHLFIGTGSGKVYRTRYTTPDDVD